MSRRCSFGLMLCHSALSSLEKLRRAIDSTVADQARGRAGTKHEKRERMDDQRRRPRRPMTTIPTTDDRMEFVTSSI